MSKSVQTSYNTFQSKTGKSDYEYLQLQEKKQKQKLFIVENLVGGRYGLRGKMAKATVLSLGGSR